jgi:hypothetical protein
MRRKKPDAGTEGSIAARIEGDVLRVTVQGRLDVDTSDRLIEVVLSESARAGTYRVLCDLRRAMVVIDSLQMNRNVARMCEEESMAGLKTALIVGVRSNNIVYFEELATHNSLPIRVFTDGALAEQWLNDADARLAAAS